MKQSDLSKYKKQLSARQVELEGQNELTASDVAPVALDQSSVGRLSRVDALQRQAMSEETRRRRLNELTRVKTALQRIADDEGNEFGTCRTCGEEIAKARLDLDPSVVNCIAHA